MGRDEDQQEEEYWNVAVMPPLCLSSSSEDRPVVSPVVSDSDDSGTSSSSDDVGPPPLLHIGDGGDSSSSEDERHPPHLEHFCDLDEWLAAAQRDIVGLVDRNESVVGPFMLTCGNSIGVGSAPRSTSSDPLRWSRKMYLEWFFTLHHERMALNPALRRLEEHRSVSDEFALRALRRLEERRSLKEKQPKKP